MPLAGYQPETRDVPLHGGNSFAVRGMSFTDIASLMRTHFPDLEALSDLFAHGFENIDRGEFEKLALVLITQAPGFVANVIAMAAGEGDASDAEKLPAPIQVRALLDIGELTFEEVGGVKKGLETIAALLSKTELKKAITKIPKKRAG